MTKNATEFSRVSNIVASTSINDPRSMAKLSMINKELYSLLQLKGLTTKEFIIKLRECMLVEHIQCISFQFEVKESFKKLLPENLFTRIALYVSVDEKNDYNYFYFAFRPRTNAPPKYKQGIQVFDTNIKKSITKVDKLISKVPISDHNFIKITKSSVYIKIPLEKEEFHGIDYIIKKWMNVEKKPRIEVEEDELDNSSPIQEIIESWYPYNNNFTSGGGSVKIKYDDKTRSVHVDPQSKKFIIIDKKRIYLSNIRGKYRYI